MTKLRKTVRLVGKTFRSDVILTQCDVAVINCAFYGCRLIVNAPTKCLIHGNKFYGGGGVEGTLAVTCGSPNQLTDKKHAAEIGTNCVGYVGKLSEKRKPAVVEGEIALFNLEGLTDAWPGKVRTVMLWNDSARYETVWYPPNPDPHTYIHSGNGILKVPGLADGEYQWCAYTPNHWTDGVVIEANEVYGGLGSGISIYGSKNALIKGNTICGCADYGIGVEHSINASVMGNACALNQFSYEAQKHWNQFEAVGTCIGLTANDNIGQFGMVPKGYFQGAR